MKEQVEVIIDSNEAAQNPKMTEVFVMHEDVSDWFTEPLEDGDIKIGNCLFERKTPSDFASSMTDDDNHLRDQVERMGALDMHSFILVEGDMKDFDSLQHSDIPPKSLRGMVASIIARNNIPVVFCSSPELLADMAVRLARKHSEDVSTVHTKTTGSMKEPNFMENLFIGVEGIGVKTAEKLAARFNSLKPVYNAKPEDFEAVEGVGPSTAKKLYDAINAEYNENESNEEEAKPSTSEVVSI